MVVASIPLWKDFLFHAVSYISTNYLKQFPISAKFLSDCVLSAELNAVLNLVTRDKYFVLPCENRTHSSCCSSLQSYGCAPAPRRPRILWCTRKMILSDDFNVKKHVFESGVYPKRMVFHYRCIPKWLVAARNFVYGNCKT